MLLVAKFLNHFLASPPRLWAKILICIVSSFISM